MSPPTYVMDVCKLGMMEKCCSYLAVGVHGFECLKLNPAGAAHIAVRRAAGTMVAQGDNCPGVNLKEKT